jgi:hypothetical protein
LREIPNLFADFATDSGSRLSAFAAASNDFTDPASATKRRSSAKDRPRLLRNAIYFDPSTFSTVAAADTEARADASRSLGIALPLPFASSFGEACPGVSPIDSALFR